MTSQFLVFLPFLIKDSIVLERPIRKENLSLQRLVKHKMSDIALKNVDCGQATRKLLEFTWT
jgi:hypothetical protein